MESSIFSKCDDIGYARRGLKKGILCGIPFRFDISYESVIPDLFRIDPLQGTLNGFLPALIDQCAVRFVHMRGELTV
jgi:hypothetical protein